MSTRAVSPSCWKPRQPAASQESAFIHGLSPFVSQWPGPCRPALLSGKCRTNSARLLPAQPAFQATGLPSQGSSHSGDKGSAQSWLPAPQSSLLGPLPQGPCPEAGRGGGGGFPVPELLHTVPRICTGTFWEGALGRIFILALFLNFFFSFFF